MKERPILFQGDMVRAILDGRKTQTRRIVKPTKDRHNFGAELAPCEIAGEVNGVDPAYRFCPYGEPGDRLWVKEAWRAAKCSDTLRPSELCPGFYKHDMGGFWYEADGAEPAHPVSEKGRYRHARFMVRWASRITLEVTGVRVERLRDISEADAWAEGCKRGDPWDNGAGYFPAEEPHPDGICYVGWDSAKEWFSDIWESINGDGSWDANPWVWVVEFQRVPEVTP